MTDPIMATLAAMDRATAKSVTGLRPVLSE